ERGVDAGELGALPRRLQELLQIVAQEIDAPAAPVLQPEREAAGAADARDGGRRERERDGLGDLRAQRAVERREDLRGGQARRAPLVPAIEGHEEERGVRGRRAREE